MDVQIAEVGHLAAVAAEGSFEHVYASSYSRSVRAAALVTGSPTVAEEIVQDAFVQLYRNWDRVQRPVPWIRVAVMNGCRTWQRRHIRERQHAGSSDLTVTNGEAFAVREALGILTPRQRAAVVLRYFEDLSEADIAEALGCRPGTVKSLLSRSMSKLREVLPRD